MVEEGVTVSGSESASQRLDEVKVSSSERGGVDPVRSPGFNVWFQSDKHRWRGSQSPWMRVSSFHSMLRYFKS